MWRKGNPYALLVEIQIGTSIKEKSIDVPSKKLEIELPYDAAILLLGIYLKKIKMLT